MRLVNWPKRSPVTRESCTNRTVRKMRWYHILRFGNCAEGSLTIGEGELAGIETWELEQGVPVTSWSAPVLRGVDPAEDGAPDDALVNHLGLPIFSPRLQGALADGVRARIQYLPVRLIRCTGAEVDGYSIANILDTRIALDRERAEFSTFPPDYFLPERRGKISGVKTFVLKAESLINCDLIRLHEYKNAIVCSEHVKLLFDKNGFTGWGFRPVDLTYTSH
jgi:hypothetical protein